MSQEQREWISTGEAAARLGYESRDAFRIRYAGIITTLRPGGRGHIKWKREEVEEIRRTGLVPGLSTIIF